MEQPDGRVSHRYGDGTGAVVDNFPNLRVVSLALLFSMV